VSNSRPPADGQIIRPPVALRVSGAPGGPAQVGDLLGRYRGIIDNFYLNCSRDYDLRGVGQQGRQLHLPGIRLRYTNNQGQETLDVVIVRPPVPAPAPAQPELPTPWDWVLIEIFADRLLDAEMQATAHIRSPRQADIATNQLRPIKGFALNFASPGTQDPDEHMLFAVPTAGVATPTITDPWSYRSFVVDLRPARGLPAVEVDLNACLIAAYTQPDYELIATQLGSASRDRDDFVVPGFWPGYTLDGSFVPGAFVDPDDAFGVEIHPNPDPAPGALAVYEPFPEVVFDTVTQSWHFADSSHGPRGYVRFQGTELTGLGTPVYVYQIFLITNPQLGGHIPLAHTPMPGNLQATLGRGDWKALFEPEGFLASEIYYRWKYQGLDDSARPGHSTLAHLDLQVLDVATLTADPATRYAIPAIGTLIVDQVHWGVSLASP
jgi:hypothetical protein